MRERKSGEGILLENREVVAIVVGSLVVLGIVFYLGVSVGRGLPREEAQPVARTLDVLDREAEQPAPTELTFPERLTDAEPVVEPAAAEAKAAEAKAAEAKAAEAKAAEAKAAEAKAAEAKAAEAKAAEAKAAEAKAAEAKAAEAKAAEAKAGAGFTVQLASFPQRAEALDLVRKLLQAGVVAQVVEATIPERGTYYRVRVGRFSSREEANAYLDDLKREGRNGIVMPADG